MKIIQSFVKVLRYFNLFKNNSGNLRMLKPESIDSKNPSEKKDMDVYLYSTLHDLKSPVNNIEALVTLLRKELVEYNNPSIDAIVEKIDHSVVSIHDNIARLSEVTKLDKEPFDDIRGVMFDEVLDEIMLENESAIKKANVRIERSFNVKEIEYSYAALKSIMSNLLTNAIKYRSPERNAKIQLSTTEKNGHVQFKVSDNGLGIDMLKHGNMLFKIFKRIHHHVEGTGLGLYVIKRIIEKKGGTIEVQSILNKGTAFQVTFKTA